MNCLIVDDDPISQAEVEFLVRQNPALRLLGCFSNAFETFNIVADAKVDLIFLDVMMPGMSGIELSKGIPAATQIILMTSERKYAAEAYDMEVSGFLSKPISVSRFEEVVAKAISIHESRMQGTADGFIFAKTSSAIVKIDTRDILYVEALGDYVSIYTADSKFQVHSTLKGIEASLPERNFVRVHKSYLVNIDRIAEIEKDTLTIEKNIIPFSLSYKSRLMERLKII